MLTRDQIAATFASDADWVNGTGAEIRELEDLLRDDFGTVFDLYYNAHSEHYPEYPDPDPSPLCRCETCIPGDVTCIDESGLD